MLSSFIGRERELAELGPLPRGRTPVDADRGRRRRKDPAGRPGRLGGAGLERFPDGAWWVELAPLADERLVGAAIAAALGVRPLPGLTELQAAGAYLASRRALRRARQLRAPARSMRRGGRGAPCRPPPRWSSWPRAGRRSGSAGETEWRVPSLSLPGTGGGRSPGRRHGRRSDAVALFIERAAEARPGFASAADDADSVAAICTELDGLPLAIELAAARVRMLSVEQIAAGLSDRFRLLTGGPRTALPRLKTLRASVDWSHELLSDRRAGAASPPRGLRRRLHPRGGRGGLRRRRRRARATCSTCSASLVDQSLVIAEEHRGRRPLPAARDGAPVRARTPRRGRRRRNHTRPPPRLLPGARGAGRPPPGDRPPARVPRAPRPRGGQPGGGDRPRAAQRAPVRAALLRGALSLVVHARPLRRGRAGACRARSMPAATREPALRARAIESRAYIAVWVGDFRSSRRRMQPRRWRSPRRSATGQPRRGRAAMWVARCSS